MSEERTDEQYAADLRLNEQCFLLANIEKFKDWGKEVKYPSMLKLNGGTPKKFIGKLVARPGLEDISKLKPEEVSRLVPYVKLYKVYYPSESSPGVEYELKFENHLQTSAVEDIMTTRAGRGSGVGIRSFEWKLAGGNPVEADRMIDAKMSLYFQSMDDLTKTMSASPMDPTGEARDVSYIDLIHQSNKFDSAPCTGDQTYNNKYFRIKATVGWSAPPAAGDDLRDTAKVMQNASATVFLTMKKHNIEFDDLGGVTLTIDYMAAPEGILSDPRADVLSVDVLMAEVLKSLTTSKKALNSQTEQACEDGTERDEDAAEEDADTLAAIDEKIRSANAERYKAFLSALETTGAIYFVDVPVADVDFFTESYFFGLIDGDLESREDAVKQRLVKMREYANSNPAWAQATSATRSPEGTVGDIKEAIDDANTDDEDDRNDAAQDVRESQTDETGYIAAAFNGALNGIFGGDRCTTANHKRINYLFLGGVLEIAFGAVRKEAVLKEIRNIVGPFDYRDPVTSEKRSICLADIPVSLNMFKVWFFEQAVVPQRELWTLKDFIKSIVSQLVEPAMGKDCFGACASGFKTRTNMRIMELPLSDDKKCRITNTTSVDTFGGGVTKNMGSLNVLPWPTESAGNQEGLHSGSYFLIYATGSTTNLGPPSEGTRVERDSALGIYHFTLGSDRGIVKKISFNREDAPHIEAARIHADGPGRLALRAAYNADVDLVGNSVFIPGQMVYIDPGSFSTQGDSGTRGSAANMLGIGGYYLVLTVENVIEAGKFDTKLTTKWQSYGEGTVSNTDKYCQPIKKKGCDDNCEEQEEAAPTTEVPGGPPGETPAP